MTSPEYKDYYVILDIPRDADEQTIKSAFRKQARTWHPDVNVNKAEATEKFKEINEAYTVLSDPVKRATYDLSFPKARQGFGGAPNHASQPKGYSGKQESTRQGNPQADSSQSKQKESPRSQQTPPNSGWNDSQRTHQEPPKAGQQAPPRSEQKPPPRSEQQAPPRTENKPPNSSDSTRQEAPPPKTERPEPEIPSGTDFLRMASLENRFYTYAARQTQTNYASEKIIPMLSLILKGAEKWINQETRLNPQNTIENNAVIEKLWTFLSQLIESPFLQGKGQQVSYQNSLFTKILQICCATINASIPDAKPSIVIQQLGTRVTFTFQSHLENNKQKEQLTVGDPPWEMARKRYTAIRNQTGASIYDIQKAQLDLISNAGFLTDAMGLLQPFSRWSRTRDCHELSPEHYNPLTETVQKCLNFFEFPMEDGPRGKIHNRIRDFKVFKSYFEAQFFLLFQTSSTSGPVFQARNNIHTAIESTMLREFTVYQKLLKESRQPTNLDTVTPYLEALVHMHVPLRAIHWAEEEIDLEITETNFKSWKEIADFFSQIKHLPKMGTKPSRKLLPSVDEAFSKLPDLFGLRFLYIYYHLQATGMVDSYREFLNNRTFSENKDFWEAFEVSLRQKEPSQYKRTVLSSLLFCKSVSYKEHENSSRAKEMHGKMRGAFSGK